MITCKKNWELDNYINLNKHRSIKKGLHDRICLWII